MPNKKYWYYTDIYYCPLCGTEDKFREKRYDERPIEWTERNHVIEKWDYCGAL